MERDGKSRIYCVAEDVIIYPSQGPLKGGDTMDKAFSRRDVVVFPREEQGGWHVYDKTGKRLEPLAGPIAYNGIVTALEGRFGRTDLTVIMTKR